ncbi:MAG: hypothetical protein PUJ82_03645 [Spirochaetales bacterium]|nr:hypothetical protein [Spirochaetales bacterium]MDY5913909.1 hypothetical protein [Treponema sp.]
MGFGELFESIASAVFEQRPISKVDKSKFWDLYPNLDVPKMTDEEIHSQMVAAKDKRENQSNDDKLYSLYGW